MSQPTQQIAMTLALYRQRGEFNRTLESAKQCLALAEYEWSGDLARIVRRLITVPVIRFTAFYSGDGWLGRVKGKDALGASVDAVVCNRPKSKLEAYAIAQQHILALSRDRQRFPYGLHKDGMGRRVTYVCSA